MTKSRLFASTLLAASALTATPASAQRIDQIVAFGDSYADDGNLFQILGPATPPQALILYPTYLSRATGRFTTPERAIDELQEWRERVTRPAGYWSRLLRPLRSRWIGWVEAWHPHRS